MSLYATLVCAAAFGSALYFMWVAMRDDDE